MKHSVSLNVFESKIRKNIASTVISLSIYIAVI